MTRRLESLNLDRLLAVVAVTAASLALDQTRARTLGGCSAVEARPRAVAAHAMPSPPCPHCFLDDPCILHLDLTQHCWSLLLPSQTAAITAYQSTPCRRRRRRSSSSSGSSRSSSSSSNSSGSSGSSGSSSSGSSSSSGGGSGSSSSSSSSGGSRSRSRGSRQLNRLAAPLPLPFAHPPPQAAACSVPPRSPTQAAIAPQQRCRRSPQKPQRH